MRIPSAARRSPPMPNVSSDGSSAFSSRTTSEAWRSPEASPAMMASFMAGCHPEPRRRRGIPCAHARGIPRFARNDTSSQWKVVHRPRQRDAAEEETDEDLDEEDDPLAPGVLPQQGEVEAGGHGVDEHQHDVVADQAHSFAS